MWYKIFQSKKPKLVRYCSKLLETITKECIVPDVIDCVPEETAKILYRSGVSVDCGNELTPTQVRNYPSVYWYAEHVYFYTLCLIDPDVPSRENPICREWQHWLVVNIPGNCVSGGDILSEYIGARPQSETGLHRYVFLIYKQPQRCTFDEPCLGSDSYCYRDKFSIKNFACKYNLGNPIAANFFLAQFDCYVPILDKKLGFEVPVTGRN